MIKKKIVVVGNRQARPIAALLEKMSDQIEITKIAIVHLLKSNQEDEYKSYFEEADFIIAQLVNDDYACSFVRTIELEKTFSEKLIKIVNLFSYKDTPYLRNLPKNLRISQAPFGDYHFPVIYESWKAGINKSEVIEQLNNWNTEYNNDHSYLDELKQRELQASVVISDFIEENTERLFHTFNHPCNKLLLEYTKRILKTISLPVSNSDLLIKGEFLGQYRPFFNENKDTNHRLMRESKVTTIETEEMVKMFYDFYSNYDASIKKSISDIPRNIIQYWDGEIPDDVAALMKTWSVKNPEYDYQLFNHKEALGYIKENFNEDVFDAFSKLTIPAMICDVFRVAFILKEGGVYIDCGIECLDSLSALELKPNQCTLLRKWNGWVCNGFICATKDDPVVQKLWDKIHNVLLKNTEGNIWALTGPKVYMEVTNEFLDNKLEFVKSENAVEVNHSGIRLLDQRKVLDVFNIVNRLEHKSRSHWSDMQKILTLFKVNYGLAVPDVFFNKKLVIHIGQHKTGSTAIQQSLFKSCDSNDYVLYPKTGAAFSGHHAISDIFQKDTIQIEKFFVDFFNEVVESPASLVILSSEYFSSGNEVFFNKVRMNKIWYGLSIIADKFADSEIVYYVRPQVGSIESRVNQAIKSRLCFKEIDFKQFFDNPTLDYNLFDEAIRKYFNKSKISPRVFSRKALVSDDVITDFNTLVDCLELPKINTNKRIDNEYAVLKCLEINNLDITIDEKMQRKKLVLNKDMNGIKNKSSFQLLDSKSRASIEEEYKKSNERFFEKYTDLDVF